MDFTTITCQKTEANDSQFWKAIGIWFNNPHVTNRRILASREILSVDIKGSVTDLCDRIANLDISFLCAECESNDINKQRLLEALELVDHHWSHGCQNSGDSSNDRIHLRVAKLLPRTTKIFSDTIEFTFMESPIKCVTSIQKSLFPEKRPLGPDKVYRIQQDKMGYTSIHVRQQSLKKEIAPEKDPSIEWLEQKLFPRLINWMTTNENEKNIRITPASLSLVSAEKYATLYNQLKQKYGPVMINIWPENTDPMKFVYEDIAIATYVMLLWEIERHERGTDKLQSFLDLGCGNGLLVHILFNEGHPGTGIDLRKRKIWSSYPSYTPLQVRTIIPSEASLFPDVDWIIGNHSDELTPWIPVIAARSSDDCRFFLLPCCPYEFDGSKYQRYSASKSQYSEYIEYVKMISEGCGFDTRIDKLRIPSTKRICLIGWKRTHEDDDGEKREEQIQKLIMARSTVHRRKNGRDKDCVETFDTSSGSSWSRDFKPRDVVEKVRNCTQLEKTLIANIVSTVAKQLLQEGRTITLEETCSRTWNAGRRLDIREIAESIPRETLRQLRKECGGLQTLIKNNNNIFSVVEGKVEFRIPGCERIEVQRKRRKSTILPQIKVKPCWFHENHPDGCPTTAIKCNYKH